MSLRVLEDTPNIRLVLGGDDKRRIAFDRDLGVILPSRFPRWLSRPTRIAIGHLDRIRITVGRDLSLELAIRHRSGENMSETIRTFAVREVDLDHEAIDLAFRIAKICRFGGYLIRGAEDKHVIELVRQAPDDRSPYRMPFPALHPIEELAGANVQEIPAILGAARYDADHARFVEPEVAVAPPQEGTAAAATRISRWQPPVIELGTPATITFTGAVIDATRNAFTAVGMVLLALVLGASFEGCRRLLVHGSKEAGFYSWKDYLAYGVAVVLTLLVGLAAVGALCGVFDFTVKAVRALRRTREQRWARVVAIDAEAVRVYARGEVLVIPRRAARGILLRSQTPTDSWCELRLMRTDDDVLLVVTPTLEDASRHPSLEAIAIGIARELDVPCRIELAARPS